MVSRWAEFRTVTILSLTRIIVPRYGPDNNDRGANR